MALTKYFNVVDPLVNGEGYDNVHLCGSLVPVPLVNTPPVAHLGLYAVLVEDDGGAVPLGGDGLDGHLVLPASRTRTVRG